MSLDMHSYLLRFLILNLSLLFAQISIASSENLGSLINQRLSIMKSVAIYKWHRELPIEDLDREKLVLNLAVSEGLKYAIKPESSRAFFQTQINAAKEIQSYWFSEWLKHPELVPENDTDLLKIIRPRLIDLGDEIINALANSNTSITDQIDVNGLSSKTIDLLQQNLLMIRKYTNQLDQILGSGILRVGTTGDYAPFSFKSKDGYRGIDIEMAKDLANSLEVELVWVETSWPTLMSDFREGKFDIAMSGVSINLKRQREAFFSNAYQVGGKSPIARCEDIDKYRSLSDIDQSATRVIVNPGGTNEKFVIEKIKNAQIVSHQDNRTIFFAIINDQADVMITDAIEVRVQTNKHSELCATMPGEQLTYSEKGYLIPRDVIWKHYVDSWLNQRINDQFMNQVYTRHLEN